MIVASFAASYYTAQDFAFVEVADTADTVAIAVAVAVAVAVVGSVCCTWLGKQASEHY